MNSPYEHTFPTADGECVQRKLYLRWGGGGEKKPRSLHALKLMKFLKTFFFFFLLGCIWGKL
jgi:hypothetical protein